MEAIVSGVLAILALLLKAWYDSAPKRSEVQRDKEINTGREAIASGNTDAVSARIDSILRDEPDNDSAGRIKDG